MSRSRSLYEIRAKSGCGIDNLTFSPPLRHAVYLDQSNNPRRSYCDLTIWHVPTSRWSWPWSSFAVDRMSLDQSLYQIWAKSNNSWLRYWRSRKFLQDFKTLLKGVDQNAPDSGRTEFHHRCTKRETLVSIDWFVSQWAWLKKEWCQRSRSNSHFLTPLYKK